MKREEWANGNQTFDMTVLFDRWHQYIASFQNASCFNSNLNIKSQMSGDQLKLSRFSEDKGPRDICFTYINNYINNNSAFYFVLLITIGLDLYM